MTVFKPELVLPIFKLQTGDVYKESKIKKGFDKLRDAYGSQGYFQWTGRPERKPDPARKVVDVTLTMDEDKKYYVGKIRFTGNSTTRDKVIRREVYLNESDVFNTELLKLSIRRINQLGYFKPMEGAPELGPSPLAEDKIDVTFKVEEQNRNQFTFGGGVSGLEGTFVNAGFSTANFLDAGRHVESRLGPSLVYNTVDTPYTPRKGARLTASGVVAGGLLGGGINYFRPDGEAVLYIPHLRKTALGLRAEAAWISP